MVSEQQSFARKLRRQATKPEDILWELVRGRRIDGLKFRRQAPFLAYTADFLCFERKLVVEIDGRQHLADRDYDATRTAEIESHGFVLIRFSNEEVLNDRDAVVAKIRAAAGVL